MARVLRTRAPGRRAKPRTGRLTRVGLRPPTPRDEIHAEIGTSRALKIVASVAANVTVFTALLYYFGLLDTQVFFAYFRVHYTLLGQTADEILGRGADGLLLPVAGAVGAGFVFIGVLRFLQFRLSHRAWSALLRGCTPIAGVAGIALATAAVPIALDPGPFRVYAGLPGLGLAIGVVLLTFSWRRWNPPDATGWQSPGLIVAQRVVTYLLVTFGLFWAVGDYSHEVGTRQAFEAAAQIPVKPDAILYSTRNLDLDVDGVQQILCNRPGAAYTYRYTGLKLLLQSGGQYVFVPAGWQVSASTTVVIPRGDSLRLEFMPAGTTPPDTC
jgi:hypothetical protein